jgi:glyoxylase-like metal-dependent hydrolase (beta-lactamase superfamily II)
MDVADRWRIGDVVITRIVDLVVPEFPTQIMFGEMTNEQVCSVKWLHPHYATPEGNLIVSFHAYLIESRGVRILVDTCVGNDKPRILPFFDQISTPFLDRLGEAGFSAGDIDYVLCTHMHVDHVGWNTCWNGERWVPTFPKARYLFGRVEWDHWQREIEKTVTPQDRETGAIIADSVAPIVDAGLNDFVETDHRITEDVRLLPTPGHTPGHVSVAISSMGNEAVIAGDVIHHPIQLTDAAITSNFDTDRNHAEATRRAFIEDASDKPVLILGTHFARPSAGWIVRDGKGWRFSPSAGTPKI